MTLWLAWDKATMPLCWWVAPLVADCCHIALHYLYVEERAVKPIEQKFDLTFIYLRHH